MSCTLNSACDCIHVLSSMVELMGHRVGLSDKQTNRMVLGVDELFANIAQHGYQGREGQVDMSASCENEVLQFELRDYAAPLLDEKALEGSELTAASELSPGGRGLQLMHAVMDSVEHQALSDGNRWRLLKNIHGEMNDES